MNAIQFLSVVISVLTGYVIVYGIVYSKEIDIKARVFPIHTCQWSLGLSSERFHWNNGDVEHRVSIGLWFIEMAISFYTWEDENDDIPNNTTFSA
jgi:hypothetical protein